LLFCIQLACNCLCCRVSYAEVKVKLTNEDVVVTPILLWNVTALRPSHCTHHNAAQSIHNHRPLYLGARNASLRSADDFKNTPFEHRRTDQFLSRGLRHLCLKNISTAPEKTAHLTLPNIQPTETVYILNCFARFTPPNH